MIRQDYIDRMIQQIGEALDRLFRRGGGQPVDQVDANLDQVASEWVGLPLSLLLAVPRDDLLAILEEGDRMRLERCLAVAEVLRARALLSPDPAVSSRLLSKALFFLEAASEGIDDGDVAPLIQTRMADLRERIG